MRCEVCYHGTSKDGSGLCSACKARGKKKPRKKREPKQKPLDLEPKEPKE